MKPKNLKIYMKLEGWGGVRKNPFCWRGVDIIWNYTFEQKYWWFHKSDLVKEKAQIS